MSSRTARTTSFNAAITGNRIASDQNVLLEPVILSNSQSYTYNAQRNRLLSAGADSFTYDNEGQLTRGYGKANTFDNEQRLTGIGADTFYYDGAGNRLKATRSGVTTKYIYDAYGNLIAEADGENVIRRYSIHDA